MGCVLRACSACRALQWQCPGSALPSHRWRCDAGTCGSAPDVPGMSEGSSPARTNVHRPLPVARAGRRAAHAGPERRLKSPLCHDCTASLPLRAVPAGPKLRKTDKTRRSLAGCVDPERYSPPQHPALVDHPPVSQRMPRAHCLCRRSATMRFQVRRADAFRPPRTCCDTLQMPDQDSGAGRGDGGFGSGDRSAVATRSARSISIACSAAALSAPNAASSAVS